MADEKVAQDPVVRQAFAALEAVLDRAESLEDYEALTMRVLATLAARALDEPSEDGLAELEALLDLISPEEREALAHLIRERLPAICRRAEPLVSGRGAARARQIRERVVRVLTPPSPVRAHARERVRARRRARRRVGRRSVASASSSRAGPEPPGEAPGPARRRQGVETSEGALDDICAPSPEIEIAAEQAGER